MSPVPQRDPGSALDPEWKRGPFLEIYVRGYYDSDGDGIGDLRGLTEKLEYIQSLGVTGIWLMPVTASQDKDHGYAVTDYRGIEPQYGTLSDFDALLREAHRRGIGVIVDYVLNHSAAQHPLFLSSAASTTSRYRDWYVWSPTRPMGWRIYGRDPWYAGTGGYYFAGFWDQMPDFNLRHPDVRAYHASGLRFWLNRGVDGFRVDAVGNLVENGPDAWELQAENHAVMREYQTLVSAYTNRYMVCESPGAPLAFTAATSCGSAFAFGHNYAIVRAAKGDRAAIADVANYFLTAPPSLATMVSNHDHFAGERLWDQVAGNEAQYRLAAATYLLQPGVPFIYYGEEIGMAGGVGLEGDWKLRTPMSWAPDRVRAGFTTGTPFRALSANVASHNVRAQAADSGSLSAFYRSMIALRQRHPSLSRGTYSDAATEGMVMRFTRRAGGETSLVAINYGTNGARAAFGGLPAGVELRRVWPPSGGTGSAAGNGEFVVAVPAQSVVVHVLER